MTSAQSGPLPNTYDRALAALRLGLRVFPLPAGKKGAQLDDWPERAARTEAELRALWAWMGGPGSNYALLMGAPLLAPGWEQWKVVAIDVDEREGVSGLDCLALLEQELGPLPETPRQLTGHQNGSCHIFLLVPAHLELRCISLDPLGGVQLKAHHGYVVGPGSVTSGVYEWEAILEPPAVWFAPMPAEWVAHCVMRSEREAKARVDDPVSPDRRETPGDYVNEITWHDLLTQWGAEPVGTKWVDGEPRQQWLRPEGTVPRSSDNDHHAVVLDGGLWTYTPNWPGLPNSSVTGRPTSKFGCYTAMTQGEISTEAFGRAKEELRVRFGLPKPPPDDLLSDELKAEHRRLEEERRRPLGDQEAGEEPSQEDEDSWEPIDLGPIIDGERVRVEPALLHRTDGQALFYRGKINGLHGDGGIGKTWVALLAIQGEIQAGRVVMVLDYEDDAMAFVGRMLEIGTDPEALRERLIYLRPDAAATPARVDRLIERIRERDVSLVVLDSVGEAFAVDEVNEDKDNEVGPWTRRVALRLANAGPAVILIDHGTKAKDNPLFESGSKRKRASKSGSSFLVSESETAPLGRTKGLEPYTGYLNLITAKDRHGFFLKGQPAATLVGTSYPDGKLDLVLIPPVADTPHDPDDIKVELAAQAACNACRLEGAPLSLRSLLAKMKYRAATTLKSAGVQLAVDRGALRLEPSPGKGRAATYTFLKDLPMAPGGTVSDRF